MYREPGKAGLRSTHVVRLRDANKTKAPNRTPYLGSRTVTGPGGAGGRFRLLLPQPDAQVEVSGSTPASLFFLGRPRTWERHSLWVPGGRGGGWPRRGR